MTETKHLLNESGVSEVFKLIVLSGAYAGTYNIEKPDGWDDFDCVVNINEDFFNIDDFIIGKEIKLKFLKYSNPIAYNILVNVYEEQGGDGQIVFKWIDIKDGVENDILGDNFEINLNEYSSRYEMSMQMVETELKFRESQNKVLTREDVSVDLFTQKDLDEAEITALTPIIVGFEKEPKLFSNFYYSAYGMSATNVPRNRIFFRFRISGSPEIGVVGTDSGEMELYQGSSTWTVAYMGQFIYANTVIHSLKAEFSNIKFKFKRADNVTPLVQLRAIIYNNNYSFYQQQVLEISVAAPEGGINYSKIEITNKTFDIGTLQIGQRVDFYFMEITNAEMTAYPITDNGSITLLSDSLAPLVKTQAIKLDKAIDRICEIYTGGDITLESATISGNGAYSNTIVSTGSFLRGLPPLYTQQKMKTSLEKLLYDGASPLLALGFDISGNKLVVESIDYFFKPVKTADLTDKPFDQDEFVIENDQDLTFNEVIFGSKKYSTRNKFDILNFNTKLEATTPTITRKKKFDKQTEFIIDQFKINELTQDKSSSTNDNDDDLALIDMVNVVNELDIAVFPNTKHSIEPVTGFLLLECNEIPFDTTFVGDAPWVLISGGINSGTWNVIPYNERLLLYQLGSPTIQTGTQHTTMTFFIPSVNRNRTTQGFNFVGGVKFPDNAVNLRHNPKYQLARWFPYFGSGLMKKSTNEIIKVNSYKNNGAAQMRVGTSTESALLLNELSGMVTTGADEPLSRLRAYKQPYFTGKTATVKVYEVTFKDFLQIFTDWKFGIGGDRFTSRGFIRVNVGDEEINIYPFGNNGLSFDRFENSLTISGKVAREYPVLKAAFTQISILGKNEVRFYWDAEDVTETNIQMSLDDVNFTTIETVEGISRKDVTNDIFEDILTGTDVYFRVESFNGEYLDYSESQMVTWTGNDWVAIESFRRENYDCNESMMVLELNGNAELTLDAEMIGSPTGGMFEIINSLGEIVFASTDEVDSFTDEITLEQLETYTFRLMNAKEVAGEGLVCDAEGDEVILSNTLNVSISDGTFTKEFVLKAETVKYVIAYPDPPEIE